MEGNNGNVIKLEGSRNWNIWKFQTTVLLRGNGWLDIVEGRSVKPDVAAQQITWESKDAKAQTLLVTRMSEDVMLHVITCATAAEMWRKLQSVYEQKTETSIHIIQQRFFQYKFEKGTEMSVFLSKIQELQNQLKQMGEEVSDKFVITKVLMSLPEEYKHFVSAWESAPDDKQTIDNLVARLLVEEERVKEKSEESQQNESSAFFVKNKKNVKCYKCGKLGHFQSECKNTKRRSEKGNSNKCYYCGKVGHYKAQCRFRKNKVNDNNVDSNKTSNAFVVSNSAYKPYQESKWLVDSGATEHMCRDRELFTTFSSVSQKSVIVGNGTAISVLGCGHMVVQVYNGCEWIDTTIDNVLFVPELKTNLFSVNRATVKGYVMMTDDVSCKFYKHNKVCAVAKRIESSYYMNLRYKCESASVANAVLNDLNGWHEKLAHQNFDQVIKVLQKNNVIVKQTSVPECESCLKGKIHRLPFNKGEHVSTKTCEIIHADTCGPMEEVSVGGSRYFVILKDDYSNFRYVYFVKAKHEVKNCLQDFINKAENVTGNRIKVFRTDNGLEFVNKEVKEMFSKGGIIHQTTVPYTPEQNGKAERDNRTLVEAARTMLHAKKLPKRLWAEAVNTAAYVLNRTGKSKESGRSPFEVWTNKSFDIHRLQTFGTPVYVHIPKERRRKWDKKGERGIMVGYGEDVKGYRIYFPQKNSVEIKRDVIFLNQEENQEKYSKAATNADSEADEIEDLQISPDITPTCFDENTVVTESEPGTHHQPHSEEEGSSDLNDGLLPTVRRSKRVRKQTSFYKCHDVHSEESEPLTYKEAMQRRDASQWSEAVNRELQTLKENNTWDVCDDVPENAKVVSSKWVFKLKGLDKVKQYKVRLVARGFEQDNVLDLNDIYAPVAKLSTFRIFVVIATKLGLPIYQMDVTGAFLYGEINGDVYISLPEGAYSDNNNIVKLNKSLYGLKSSPKCWNNKFNSVITREGFIRSSCDSCLYKKYNDNDKTFVLLYVDDLLMFGSNQNYILQLKSVLSKEFEMKDLGLVSDYLGINVKQDLETGITELTQSKYLKNVLKRFNMENCKPMLTPMDVNFNTKIFFNASSTAVDKDIEKLCRQMIGCLMYAVSGTRPDLCFAVSMLSRYQKCANNVLLAALKRVLRYVKHTIDYKLVYKCSGDNLVGFCDSDWGGDVVDRKSTSGYMFMFSNCLVQWSSKKQASVSLSSTESEYVAMSMAASEASWLVNVLNDFGVQNVCPVNIFCDNQSAISGASTESIKRLKHVDIRYHFIKELCKNNKICLNYINTSEQPADIFTKPLCKELIVRHLKKCGLG